MKTGKSLSTKIILMVGAILLLSSAMFCAVSISVARVGIRKAIQQRMVDIANCAAGSVNGDILESLWAGDEDTPEYKTIFDSMAVFRDNAELEYIYAIKDEGNGRFTFIVDTDQEAPGAFGDEVKYTEALERASKGTTSVDEVPYSDQWGEFTARTVQCLIRKAGWRELLPQTFPWTGLMPSCRSRRSPTSEAILLFSLERSLQRLSCAW